MILYEYQIEQLDRELYKNGQAKRKDQDRGPFSVIVFSTQENQPAEQGEQRDGKQNQELIFLVDDPGKLIVIMKQLVLPRKYPHGDKDQQPRNDHIEHIRAEILLPLSRDKFVDHEARPPDHRAQ